MASPRVRRMKKEARAAAVAARTVVSVVAPKAAQKVVQEKEVDVAPKKETTKKAFSQVQTKAKVKK